MTLEDYKNLEQDLSGENTDLKTFLQARGTRIHKYYYWKRKARDLGDTVASSGGQFLPIDMHTGGMKSIRRQGKTFKQPMPKVRW